MSGKTRQQKQARALQKRTGWSYSECLRCLRTMSPEAIEKLVEMRAGAKSARADFEKSD